MVGIEVKQSATVRADDFKGLRALAEVAKSRFHRGVVLYTGEKTIPFAENLFAVPLQTLSQVPR